MRSAAVLLLAAACAPARMQLPPPLAEDAALPVKGAHALLGDVRFGPWTATGVRRGLAIGETSSTWVLDEKKARRTYRFEQLGPDGQSWPTRCGTDYQGSDIGWESADGRSRTSVPVTAYSTLVCTVSTGAGRPDWLLQLHTEDTGLTGTLGDGSQSLRVVENHDLAGTSLDAGSAAGFVFFDGETPVAAVEVLNKGRVWLPEGGDPDRQHALAAAATALLLYRDLGR